MVNIASSDGELIPYSEPLKQAFIDASKACTGACTALMERFAAEVLPEKVSPEGWPSAPYGYAVSKAGVIAFTKAMALEAEKSQKKVLINACCPGFVNTDMTNGNGTMTVDEGAKTPVLLALGDIKGISGGFWKHEAVAVWRPSIPN
jgi:carbonyl reductase 1